MAVKYINTDWDKSEMKTVLGKLDNGVLLAEEGPVFAVTFGIIKQRYEGIRGFYNLLYSSEIGYWIITDCVPWDEMIS